MSDINDKMPRIPGMKWGALFNWKLSDAEINQLLRRPPFPEDNRWHDVNKHNNDVSVDGRLIRGITADKLT